MPKEREILRHAPQMTQYVDVLCLLVVWPLVVFTASAGILLNCVTVYRVSVGFPIHCKT